MVCLLSQAKDNKMGRKKKSEKGVVKVLKVVESKIKNVEVIKKGSTLEKDIAESELQGGARFIRGGQQTQVLGENAVAGGGGGVVGTRAAAVEEKPFSYNMKSDDSRPKYAEAPRAPPVMRDNTGGGAIRIDASRGALPTQGRGFTQNPRMINPVAGMDANEEKYEFREHAVEEPKKKKIL
jgi:hypothetical protein